MKIIFISATEIKMNCSNIPLKKERMIDTWAGLQEKANHNASAKQLNQCAEKFNS